MGRKQLIRPGGVNPTTKDERPWFLEALKERVRETESDEHLLLLVNAIADRRIRDLSDIVSEMESALGWGQVVAYLSQVVSKEYPTPFDLGLKKARLEPLKYREVLFELFSCKGFEPANIHTSKILDLASSESSLVDASRLIFQELKTKVSEQIAEGDVTFFEANAMDTDFPEDLRSLLSSALERQVKEVRLEQRGHEIDVWPLWNTHAGLQALVDIGVEGRFVNNESLTMVLSVLQTSVDVSYTIQEVQEFTQPSGKCPTHEEYRKLLGSLINQDILSIMNLGSRLAVPTLSFILSERVLDYTERGMRTSETLRSLLRTVIAHTRIRSIESVIPLGNLCYLDEPHLSTAAIVALSNFYDPSAVHTLAALLCTTNSDAVAEETSKAIMSISSNCVETTQVLNQILAHECRNPVRIRKLLRNIPSRQRYYL